MEKFEVKRRWMPITGKWCNPARKMPNHTKKGWSGKGIGHERFENKAFRHVEFLYQT